jgi:hypothetical protein
VPDGGSASKPAAATAFGEILSSPSKGDPAKDYVYMRRDAMPEVPGHAPQNASAGETSASAPGDRPTQPPGFSPLNASTSAQPSPASSASEADATRGEKEHGILGPIEKYLATFLGPMAGIIVQRAASKTKNREELVALLAATLPPEKDRQAFLARKDYLLRDAVQFQPMEGSSTGHSAVQPSTSPPAADLTPASIRRASELLTPHLGPVSGILTQRAAQRAESLRALYFILAEHLKDPRERARFLREAGFPES